MYKGFQRRGPQQPGENMELNEDMASEKCPVSQKGLVSRKSGILQRVVFPAIHHPASIPNPWESLLSPVALG